MRYTFERLNLPLLLFRTAKSQSLLDREMGGHVLCISLVGKCAFIWRSLCQNRGWDPGVPFPRLVPWMQVSVQNRAEYRVRHHRLLDLSLQVVPSGQWGSFSWNFVLNLTSISVVLENWVLYFCGKANSSRKKFPCMWSSWPSYYCYNYIKREKKCHFNCSVFAGKQISCHLQLRHKCKSLQTSTSCICMFLK